jgi:hypothetical protein
MNDAASRRATRMAKPRRQQLAGQAATGATGGAPGEERGKISLGGSGHKEAGCCSWSQRWCAASSLEPPCRHEQQIAARIIA